MTSKLSKIATAAAAAFLAVGLTACDDVAHVETAVQFANQQEQAAEPATNKYEFVISHADGKYEEFETVVTHDVHGNRI